MTRLKWFHCPAVTVLLSGAGLSWWQPSHPVALLTRTPPASHNSSPGRVPPGESPTGTAPAWNAVTADFLLETIQGRRQQSSIIKILKEKSGNKKRDVHSGHKTSSHKSFQESITGTLYQDKHWSQVFSKQKKKDLRRKCGSSQSSEEYQEWKLHEQM